MTGNNFSFDQHKLSLALPSFCPNSSWIVIQIYNCDFETSIYSAVYWRRWKKLYSAYSALSLCDSAQYTYLKQHKFDKSFRKFFQRSWTTTKSENDATCWVFSPNVLQYYDFVINARLFTLTIDRCMLNTMAPGMAYTRRYDCGARGR